MGYCLLLRRSVSNSSPATNHPRKAHARRWRSSHPLALPRHPREGGHIEVRSRAGSAANEFDETDQTIHGPLVDPSLHRCELVVTQDSFAPRAKDAGVFPVDTQSFMNDRDDEGFRMPAIERR
jgi:hypothetical protein